MRQGNVSEFHKSGIEETRYGKIDPRHIERYMRLGNSTLDDLSRSKFVEEIRIGIECVLADGLLNAEKLAKSYGL
jgi:hypothetical protein